MQTIIIVLDSKKMTNPDLDIRYNLPQRIEEISDNQISDNGYDYLSDTELGIWLETDNAAENVQKVIQLIKSEKFMDNDLSKTADIYISAEDCADVEQCEKVYPL